ncbi:hypothetical protein HDV03_000651 [Kappamyces sp. JEL0829]|nr:hypothetical protein HDV03_000651 [Kappamyces sp. JEL0829]
MPNKRSNQDVASATTSDIVSLLLDVSMYISSTENLDEPAPLFVKPKKLITPTEAASFENQDTSKYWKRAGAERLAAEAEL